MAAPEFVPAASVRSAAKAYSSPPRRAGSWRADRPGDLGGQRQPNGEALGSQGPDQGYAIKLAKRFADRIELASGEHAADALAAGVAIALRRASLFGRAPMTGDLEAALSLLGYLGAPADDELVDWRRSALAEVAHTHHYGERRQLANQPAEATLRLTPEGAEKARVADWRSALGVV